jgi:hypothetical protein
MKARSVALSVLLLANSTMGLFGAVDLVTIPRREGTQLTIYNSADITMVRENRLLTVKPGINRIQFSWANTLIDPTSIDFRIMDHIDKVDLLDTTFPSGRNDALQWNIRSGMAGKIPVEIRYFTSGITWKADYVGIANQSENKMGLTGYVRVVNNSGELYDNAEVRLVVGNINLVEKIADLASRPPPTAQPSNPSAPESRVRQDLFLTKTKDFALARDSGNLSGGMKQDIAKDVKKQGLSEYFLFTISGREDIKNKEPKRLVSMKITDVPLKPIYKLTDRDGGQRFTKYYRFKNKKLLDDAGAEKTLPAMENLGESPLPDGMVRLFSEYDNQDLAYVGGTSTKYVPIGDRVEVNVGRDNDITMRQRLKDQRIRNIVSRQYKRRIDDDWVMYYDHIDYDETFVYEEEIVSGKAVDAKLEIERRFAKDVTLWGSEGKPRGWDADISGAYVDMHEIESRIEKVDQNHVKYFLDTRPGQRWVLTYTVTYKHRAVGPELNQRKRWEPLR